MPAIIGHYNVVTSIETMKNEHALSEVIKAMVRSPVAPWTLLLGLGLAHSTRAAAHSAAA